MDACCQMGPWTLGPMSTALTTLTHGEGRSTPGEQLVDAPIVCASARTLPKPFATIMTV